MIEFNPVTSENEEIFQNDRIVAIQNDGKFSLTQLWEVIVKNKRLPGTHISYILLESFR